MNSHDSTHRWVPALVRPDEPLEQVMEAFEQGEKRLTAMPPAGHQRSYDDDPGLDASQAMADLNVKRFEAAEEFIRASDILRELARAGHPPTEPDRFRMTDAQRAYDTLTRAYRVMVS